MVVGCPCGGFASIGQHDQRGFLALWLGPRIHKDFLVDWFRRLLAGLLQEKGDLHGPVVLGYGIEHQAREAIVTRQAQALLHVPANHACALFGPQIVMNVAHPKLVLDEGMWIDGLASVVIEGSKFRRERIGSYVLRGTLHHRGQDQAVVICPGRLDHQSPQEWLTRLTQLEKLNGRGHAKKTG